MCKLYILGSINYNFILTMERGTIKKCWNPVKQIDEANDCNVFQKDSDKFVVEEAEAGQQRIQQMMQGEYLRRSSTKNRLIVRP